VCQTDLVLPKRGDYGKTQRRLERALEPVPDSADAVLETFLTTVADVLELDSSCWHHTDPASGSPVSSSVVADPPGSEREAMQYEFRRPDVNRFSELVRDRAGVASISLATGRRPARSLRFREMIEPAGLQDELRISCKDAFGTWAAVAGFTRRPMTEDDVRFVAEAAPTVTESLRLANAAEWAPECGGTPPDADCGPSVLILDANDRILAADAVARQRLELLPTQAPVRLPGIVAYLAARARWDATAHSASARTRTPDGRWFVLDASAMDDVPGNVAVVMQPASSPAVLAHVLRSHGLSVRERQIAALLAQGQSAKSIAANLVLSPWTVQDHIKAIYRKTGVGARSDLSSLAAGAGAA
jgi:DNA-binding CsgD family transcriptional regulator